MKKDKKKSLITRIDTDDTRTDAEKIPLKSVSSPQKSAIQWQAPEFEYYQKDVSWYWLSLIAAIILIALSIWQKNFLFAVFVIIAWLVIIYSAGRSPTSWKFKISEEGVEVALPKEEAGTRKFYPYAEIEGFDIHEAAEGYKELILKLKTRFSPYLKINISDDDEEKIKNFLLKFLAKEEYHVSLADSISKLIRF